MRDNLNEERPSAKGSEVMSQINILKEALADPATKPNILFVSNQRLLLKNKNILLEFVPDSVPEAKPELLPLQEKTAGSGGAVAMAEAATSAPKEILGLLGRDWFHNVSCQNELGKLIEILKSAWQNLV